jgi:seryl-tRNA synthetase
MDKEMSEPKRYTAAGSGVVKTDPKGDLVLYLDYARLMSELDELKSQPDPLTAYLYAAELAKDDIKRLKAEVERLTKQVERLIVSLQKSHDEHGEALYKLKYKNERQTPRKKRSS